MKFLVDAQLPQRMVDWLRMNGCDALHTLDLRDANRTTDLQILDLAEQEQRIIITKDSDFVNSYLLWKRPSRLLLISTGNISNQDLEELFLPIIPTLVTEFQTGAFLEMTRSGLILRG